MTNPFPSRTSFRAWLAAKTPEEVISQDWTCISCPIANYTASLGLPSYIDPNCESWWRRGIGDSELIDLSFWAKHFANSIDVLNDNNHAVTAAECLAILDAIPED